MNFKNGKFRFMQITDIQDTQNTSPDTIRFLKQAIIREKPDLCILTGDQLKGYAFSFLTGDKKEKGRTALRNILSVFEETNTPFIYTYGNHDEFADFTKSVQDEIYLSCPMCKNSEAVLLGNQGNICLDVTDESGNPALLIYALDTLCKDKNGDYTGVSKEIIDATSEHSKKTAEIAGKTVPAFIFQHIPVPEMYDILKVTNENTVGAVKGHRCRPDEFFILPEEMIEKGYYMHENIACPTVSNGQFDSWVNSGNVLAAFFGHDHINNFSGKLKGIELGYTPGSGFNCYGPGFDRAVRMLEFDGSSGNYETYTVTFRDVCGEKYEKPVKGLIYEKAPSSVEVALAKAKKMLVKGAVVSAGLATGIIIKNLKSRK